MLPPRAQNLSNLRATTQIKTPACRTNTGARKRHLLINEGNRREVRAPADSKVFRKVIKVSDGKQYVSDVIKYFRIWDGKPQYYNSWD